MGDMPGAPRLFHPLEPIVGIIRPAELRWGRHDSPSNLTSLGAELHCVRTGGLAAALLDRRGNCTTRGADTPTTRRQTASCSAKPLITTSMETTAMTAMRACWLHNVACNSKTQVTQQCELK